MKGRRDPGHCDYRLSRGAAGEKVIQLSGKMDAVSAPALIREFADLFKARAPVNLTVDLEAVSYLDDFGALVLVELKKRVMARKGRFALRNVPPKAADILAALDFERLGRPVAFTKVRRPGVLARLGEGTLGVVTEVKYMLGFIGSLCLALGYVILHPRSLRVDDTFVCMQKTGVDALPIVALISFLLGLIMAFMSSVQLQQFGANVYVASLVSLSMTRELGPIMTAIIVAGRSGSAFAAEIGTMRISEEVDALFTMGFEPTRFLVVPKVIAALIVVPLLTLFSDLFAILGGLVVGVSMLDLTVSAYVAQTVKTLELFDVYWGVTKSAVFALLIAWVGCLRGFRVRGGPAAVGEATTSAVVSSIFLIVVTDSIFAVLLRYWG